MSLKSRLSQRRSAVALSCAALSIAAVGAINATAAGAAVAPAADYQLQNVRSSSVAGAPTLTDIGTGNAFTKTTVDSTTQRTVLAYPKGNGLQASPISALTDGVQYSIALLYKPATISGYQRLLDFNAGVGDVGLYQLNGGLSAYPTAASTSSTLISTTSFNQVVLTRTTGKVVTAYVNGTKALSFTDSSDAWKITATSIRFFKDNTSSGATGEEGAGQVARLRVFKTALTASDVSSLDRLATNSADLGVKLTDAPDPVLHGNLLSYVATITNNGPGVASGAKLTVTIPSTVTFVGSSPSTGTCAAPASSKIVCTVGTMAIGATATVLVVVKAPAAAGSISGSAVSSATTTDGASSNNTATATTTVH
jgi:uncharacterized repeat protein (TIGR01451 family)